MEEKKINPVNERRIGCFTIYGDTLDLIRSGSYKFEDAVSFFKNLFVVSCESIFSKKFPHGGFYSLKYIAFSPDFEPVEEEFEPPEYTVVQYRNFNEETKTDDVLLKLESKTNG